MSAPPSPALPPTLPVLAPAPSYTVAPASPLSSASELPAAAPLVLDERVNALLDALLPPSCALDARARRLVQSLVERLLALVLERVVERRRAAALALRARLPKVSARDVYAAVRSVPGLHAVWTRLASSSPVLASAAAATAPYALGTVDPKTRLALRHVASVRVRYPVSRYLCESDDESAEEKEARGRKRRYAEACAERWLPHAATLPAARSDMPPLKKAKKDVSA